MTTRKENGFSPSLRKLYSSVLRDAAHSGKSDAADGLFRLIAADSKRLAIETVRDIQAGEFLGRRKISESTLLSPENLHLISDVFNRLAEEGRALEYINLEAARTRGGRFYNKTRQVYLAVEECRRQGLALGDNQAFAEVGEKLSMAESTVSRHYYEYKHFIEKFDKSLVKNFDQTFKKLTRIIVTIDSIELTVQKLAEADKTFLYLCQIDPPMAAYIVSLTRHTAEEWAADRGFALSSMPEEQIDQMVSDIQSLLLDSPLSAEWYAKQKY